MEQKTIDTLKIISNIILIAVLLAVLITTLLYKQDVQEAIGLKEPVKLMQLYENMTDTKCLCAMEEYGSVVYIPYKN
jgi:hypothetical protein